MDLGLEGPRPWCPAAARQWLARRRRLSRGRSLPCRRAWTRTSGARRDGGRAACAEPGASAKHRSDPSGPGCAAFAASVRWGA
jgi:hypothetical protein